MESETPETIEPVSLAYSAPPLDGDTSNQVASLFYNAFPEFNGRAADGSRTAIPDRAKYSLVLDSVFIPSGVTIRNDEEGKQHLKTLSSYWQSHFETLFRDYPDAATTAPRSQHHEKTWRLHEWFELAHLRLAKSSFKSKLRYTLIAPLFTLLEHAVVSGQKIAVPLIPDDSPRATKVQRQWAKIIPMFKATQLIDEVFSLQSVMWLADAMGVSGVVSQEKFYLEEHEQEFPGFTDVYRVSDDYFMEQFIDLVMERDYETASWNDFIRDIEIDFANKLVWLGKFIYNHGASDYWELIQREYKPIRETPIVAKRNIEMAINIIKKSYSSTLAHSGEYASITDNSNHASFIKAIANLEVTKRIADANFYLRFYDHSSHNSMSIPELIERLLAVEAYNDTEEDDSKTFIETRENNKGGWSLNTCFALRTDKDVTYLRATPVIIHILNDEGKAVVYFNGQIRPERGLQYRGTIPFYPSGSTLDNTDMTCYFIFLEAIRQQICLGVGLRCPFFGEKGCCNAYKNYIQRIYEITVPRIGWGKHWIKPPCLE